MRNFAYAARSLRRTPTITLAVVVWSKSRQLSGVS
jgi:hypothetical protein